MKILLLGSGGREHTLAWKIAQSSLTDQLFIAPGNAGTAQCGTNVSLNPNDFNAIGQYVLENNVELVVVGPEEPLVNGIYDYFRANSGLNHISIVGPSKAGAALEGSKDFAKEFMVKNNIPTARYKSFTGETVKSAIAYLEDNKPPYVLKADGLAAGKGVIITSDIQEATGTIKEMLLDKKFGVASEKVVIEQFLTGIELSVFVLTDGNNWLLLPEAKDYKRIGEGDTGPNTGGMGSVSPVSFADATFMDKVKNRIIQPTIDGLKKEGIDYRGFIFFGLINVDGDPFVIEYNIRMGDPETESVIPRIKTDLVPLLKACADGDLSAHKIETEERAAVTVMLVSGGYPGNYSRGYPITGLNNDSESILFHAGTTVNNNQQVVTAGGRVIAVTSLALDAKQALQKSFEMAQKIEFKDKYFRNDIGFDIIK
ncbi:MAG: phosphoribosylamine--glycine ligase [Chloroflexota bacterium]